MERRAIGGLRPWRRAYTAEWFGASGENGTIEPLEEESETPRVSLEKGAMTGISPERREKKLGIGLWKGLKRKCWGLQIAITRRARKRFYGNDMSLLFHQQNVGETNYMSFYGRG